MIFSLGSEVRDTVPQTVPYASSLVDLNTIASRLELSCGAQAICIAALSLFGSPHGPEKLLGVSSCLDLANPLVAPLLAMGLVNTLVDAKQEEALERRDALLEELRTLTQAFPQDAVLRKIGELLDSV